MSDTQLIKLLEERLESQSARIKNLHEELLSVMMGLETTSSRALAAQDMLLFLALFVATESPGTARRFEAALSEFLSSTEGKRDTHVAEPYRHFYHELGHSVARALKATPERLRESFQVVKGKDEGSSTERDA